MQKLQLFIPEPCHENWHQMTPTDQGRFCNACAKEVVDFSMMTDTEVLNYFTALTHEKVCGRALPDQLNRTIKYPGEPKKKLFWYWNYIVMFFMFFAKGNSAKAQGGVKANTECSPVKTNEIRGEMKTTVTNNQVSSRVITGKITDKNGNAVSFATIKIKGTEKKLSADLNGDYSIKVNVDDMLVISAASFAEKEIPAGTKSVVNVVLETGTVSGGISFRNISKDFSQLLQVEETAIIKVKDDVTGKYLQNVAIKISRNENSDTVFTDRKGSYKIKGIKEDETCFIKVMADGYEANEFVIKPRDLKDTKKEWEVFLRKQQIPPIRSGAAAKAGTETTIRLGGVMAVSKDNKPLYVVDGEIWVNKSIDTINPDDIENITEVKAPEASTLYGPKGINGAIVITTRKAKEMSLKEVVVTSSDIGIKKVVGMVGVMRVSGLQVKNKKESENIKSGEQVKIYPNPVQRGNTFNIALKLKQTGPHQIQITDATGRIVLQKQINALTKVFTEQIIADSRWSAGVYFIGLFDTKNQLINRRSFIFQ